MAHAEKCPICNGEGKINGNICHGCGGKGWVEIQDNTYWPIYPHPPYNPYGPPYSITYSPNMRGVDKNG